MRRSERPLSKSCCTALILRAGAQVGRESHLGAPGGRQPGGDTFRASSASSCARQR